MAGNRDQGGMEEEVRIAVRKVGRSPVGMVVVEDSQEELDQLPEGDLEGDFEAPYQVPDREQAVACPVLRWLARPTLQGRKETPNLERRLIIRRKATEISTRVCAFRTGL